MYLPEMDADYNIISFIHFENEEHYEITRDVPEDYGDKLFRVGDPAPIMFWFKKVSRIVEGDAEKAKLEALFGLDARTHPVLRDLGEILDDARTGKIKAQQEEWLAQELKLPTTTYSSKLQAAHGIGSPDTGRHWKTPES